MKRWAVLAGALLLVLPGAVRAGDAGTGDADAGPPDIPFLLPVPKGWKTETMTFPLDFASLLPYRGFEELRFSPGMFKPDQPDFFSYVFLWWLEGRDPINPGTLNSAMKEYFEGLAENVEARRAVPPGAIDTLVKFERDAAARSGEVVFRGPIETYEPFTTHQRLKLNARVSVFNCVDAKRTAVLFQISPKPYGDAIWKQLGAFETEFRCTKPR